MTTPAVYDRKPAAMSAKTWAWCSKRWPFFADARRVTTPSNPARELAQREAVGAHP